MLMSHLFTKTRKENPADEESRNAQLLIRAGYIHKEMAGVYAYMPLGKRVLDKVAQIVREEMNSIGGMETQMTVLQPRDIFELTDRWDDAKVDNWFKTKLTNGTELGMGLTHEEPFVDALKEHISSYKDLPVYVYQIQNKFRNEKRAKSGLLRGREFIMKDMYSFARTQEEHDELYERAAEAYHRIYARLGIGGETYRTYADGGIFTSRFSDEYQTLSPIGEDTIYVHKEKRIAVNQEIYTDENLEKLGLKKEELVEEKAVEVGNIFPLESKYSDALELFYTDAEGQKQSVIMGCYGVGVSRLVGLLAEHFADERGLVWPRSIAPFVVHIVQLAADNESVIDYTVLLTDMLREAGIEYIVDDREGATAGAKLTDADLMGMPYRIVVSPKSIDAGGYACKLRTETEESIMTLDEVVEWLE
jgi:prolyl-tRNA synthetase